MPLLDTTGQRIADSWRLIADDAPVPTGADVLLPPARFAAEASRITGRRGLVIASDTPLETITPFIDRVALIGIRFATFKDGRPFSLGHLLRTRLGFTGDLRAFGPFLPDQALFLVRTGFTSFDVTSTFDEAAFGRAATAYTHAYQGQAGPLRTVASRRHGGDGGRDWTRLIELKARYGAADAATLTAAAITTEFPGAIALSSSFGAESAVLLHMVAVVDRATPVLFLDSGKLFPETLKFRDDLAARLGLTRIEVVAPAPEAISMRDGAGTLWMSNPDSCCELRKVEPLARALQPYRAWITGRKASQGGSRAALEAIELVDGRFKFNPLVHWGAAETAAYIKSHNLPVHPLVAQGFGSIGCVPCTTPIKEGELSRAGRWRGTEKTECGIHDRLKRAAQS